MGSSACSPLPLEVRKAYAISEVATVTSLGSGNINDTFVVKEGVQRFVLQRMSSHVFPEPLGVIRNFTTAARHIIQKASDAGIAYRCAEPVMTSGGEYGCEDGQGCWWRAQSYLSHLSAESVSLTVETAGQLGRTLACFHHLTCDLEPSHLSDPIPLFHNTPAYLSQYDRVLASGRERVSEEREELRLATNLVATLRRDAGRLEDAIIRGNIARRVIHGDPKLDNVIFSHEGDACGFFDLDTLGPGFLLYDLGDCLRSSCNVMAENEVDFAQAQCDLATARAVMQGYCRRAGEGFSKDERSLVYDALLVITFELGLRFLTDHLEGDLYFKTEKSGDNLIRALVQLHLALDIQQREEAIREAICW